MAVLCVAGCPVRSDIGGMVSLEHLDVSHNSLHHLAPQLSSLLALTHLEASDNKLHQSTAVPEELVTLTGLRVRTGRVRVQGMGGPRGGMGGGRGHYHRGGVGTQHRSHEGCNHAESRGAPGRRPSQPPPNAGQLREQFVRGADVLQAAVEPGGAARPWGV